MSANQRWVLLTSLKAASVYQFRVSAVNSVGEGSPSEPSNVVKLPQEGMCSLCAKPIIFLSRKFVMNFGYLPSYSQHHLGHLLDLWAPPDLHLKL